MQIDTAAACALLKANDDILILTHQRPDGDTFGCGFALLWALEALGKRARVENSDGYPDQYRYIYGGYVPVQFAPKFVVTVDVASPDLLGSLAALWADKIDLCIDHHRGNTLDAKAKLIDPEAPAASEILYDVVKGLGAPFTPRIATAVFAGVSTDTGCFMFDNVTARTHRIAAEMIDAGAEHALVNKLMFDTKTKTRIEVDKVVYNTLEYYFGGLCALITIPGELISKHGVTEADLDGISSFPRKVEGVIAGVTVRDMLDGSCKISLRTAGGLDAAAICRALDGGGHKNAAGCTIPGSLQHAKDLILAQIGKAIEELPA